MRDDVILVIRYIFKTTLNSIVWNKVDSLLSFAVMHNFALNGRRN